MRASIDSTRVVTGGVAANLAGRTPPLDERNQRSREARLGRTPLAQQHDEILADRDQGPDDARERLVDRNPVEICLRQAPSRLLVRRPLERPQERLAGRKMAVERAARDPGRRCDFRHAGALPRSKHTRRRGQNPVLGRGAAARGHYGLAPDKDVTSMRQR